MTDQRLDQTRLEQSRLDDGFDNRAEAFEEFDNTPLSPIDKVDTIGDIINRRYGRRDVMKGMLGVTATTALFGSTALTAADKALANGHEASFSFTELESGNDENHHIADGYDADVLIRWGDKLFPMRRTSIRRTKALKASCSSSATTMIMLALCR
jgi:secreted PhoX family phosphatase